MEAQYDTQIAAMQVRHVTRIKAMQHYATRIGAMDHDSTYMSSFIRSLALARRCRNISTLVLRTPNNTVEDFSFDTCSASSEFPFH